MNLPKNRWPRTGTAGWTKLPINPIHLQEGCVVPTNAGGVSCGGSDEWVGRNTTPENDLSGYGKQWGRATWLQTRLPLWTQLYTGSPPVSSESNGTQHLCCTARPSPVPTQSFKDGATPWKCSSFWEYSELLFLSSHEVPPLSSPVFCTVSMIFPFVLPAFLGCPRLTSVSVCPEWLLYLCFSHTV